MVDRERECGQEDPIDLHDPLHGLTSSAIFDLADARFPRGFDNTLYGDFRLTKAVRPQSGLGFVPQEGYSWEEYLHQRTSASVEGIKVAFSAEKIIDALDSVIALFEFGETLDVEIRSSHSGVVRRSSRYDIDPVVLRTILNDFEDPILNDGCLSLIVSCDRGSSTQVELDEDKLLKVSSDDREFLHRVVQYLDHVGVRECPGLRYIDEANHVNVTTDQYPISFHHLASRLKDTFSQN